MIDTTLILPALLALLSACLFAVAIQLIGVGLENLDNRSGTLVNISTTALMFWLLAPFFLHSHFWWTEATLLFALAGIVQPALSVSLATEGFKRLGPTLSSGLAATNPLFAVILAVILLGETVTWPIAIGTVAVIAGIVVSAQTRGSSGTFNWPLWALLLPLGAAFSRASSLSLVKLGFEEVPSPFFAVLVTYTVSFIIISTNFGLSRRRLPHFNSGFKWFIMAGILNGISILSLSFAAKLGPIVTIAPISACTPIFSMLLGLFIFRREVITWQIVLTLLLVVPGIIFVVVQ